MCIINNKVNNKSYRPLPLRFCLSRGGGGGTEKILPDSVNHRELKSCINIKKGLILHFPLFNPKHNKNKNGNLKKIFFECLNNKNVET